MADVRARRPPVRRGMVAAATRLAPLALALPILACGGGGRGASDSARVAAAAESARVAAATAPSTVASGDTTCPMQGEWRPCSVKKRLESAGLVPVAQPEPVRRPFLSVPGTAYALGPYAELVVFVYPSREARERESAPLDSAAAAPRGTGGDWKVPPTLMTSNNLLAVLLAQNEHLIERVGLAITAGLPAADASAAPATTLKGVDVKARPR